MNNFEQLDISHLPRNVQALIAIIGVSATLALVEAFPGRTLTLSKGKRADGLASFAQVAEIIGDANALKLAKERDGIPIYIPKCDFTLRALREARNSKIRLDYDRLTLTYSGRATVAMLALDYKLSDRQIYNIANSLPTASRNLELCF